VFVGRLNRAVNQACNDRSASSPTLTLGRSDGFQSCRAKALDEAMSRVDAPAVKDRIARLMNRPDPQFAADGEAFMPWSGNQVLRPATALDAVPVGLVQANPDQPGLLR
jgi:hypothetical protein